MPPPLPPDPKIQGKIGTEVANTVINALKNRKVGAKVDLLGLATKNAISSKNLLGVQPAAVVAGVTDAVNALTGKKV